MTIENEIRKRISDHWQHKQVASWAIECLPILEIATHTPCPIYHLSLQDGLFYESDSSQLDSFRVSPKLVMSGGFEGNKGHMAAIENMHEARALSGEEKTSIVILLEPDSYIYTTKRRSPLTRQSERAELWSKSGTVDAVIMLPEKEISSDTTEHYLQIHNLISPALWCANIDNPNWKEIVTRPNLEKIDGLRVFYNSPEVHSSYLDSTQNMHLNTLKWDIWRYALEFMYERYESTGEKFTMPQARELETYFMAGLK